MWNDGVSLDPRPKMARQVLMTLWMQANYIEVGSLYRMAWLSNTVSRQRHRLIVSQPFLEASVYDTIAYVIYG